VSALPIGVGIVVISDGVAAGTREDTSGGVIAQWAEARGHKVVERVVVADVRTAIEGALKTLSDSGEMDVLLTTGGTGLTDRDVTPEATAAVLERQAPGIAEAMRADGAAKTPYAWISRGVAGTRGKTLIINLPGSESGVSDGLAVLDRFLSHAVQLIRGIETSKH
jgi:molybdopterin adenylyltransferase